MYMYERRSMEEETEGGRQKDLSPSSPFLSSSVLLCMYMYMHGIANVMSYCLVIHIEHNIVLYLITCTCTLKYLHTYFLLPPPPLLASLSICNVNEHTCTSWFLELQMYCYLQPMIIFEM